MPLPHALNSIFFTAILPYCVLLECVFKYAFNRLPALIHNSGLFFVQFGGFW